MAQPVLMRGEGLSKAFGGTPLFRDLTLQLLEGDRVGLVGPNGAGKSTLLKILAGNESPDDGTLLLRKNLRVGYVPQDPVFAAGQSVEEVLIEAVEARGGPDERGARQNVSVALARAGFSDPRLLTDHLSGGWRKRLAIARELALEPDVLLLDEPTNHLDVEAILWLESVLLGSAAAFVVVSHDRYFLERVARRMVEIDRSYPEGLLSVDGSYTDFLESRDRLLKDQAAYRDTLANLVRREVEWLRRGAKARTSKSRSRIQSAERMIDELQESRARGAVSTAGIEFSASGRKTRRLWDGQGLDVAYDDRTIVRGLDLLLTPGMRLGVLGRNASGKTTLLRAIAGELEPAAGTIRRADHLRVVYFQQNRESLDGRATLKRALAPDGDGVVYRGREHHVASWARRFLFRPEQLEMPVGRLSGGERARIVLARLMLQPADLLLLDEPTNDLDIPTLDVLEESLLDFPGALVLVTHDRYLLDRISTSILALDGEGGVESFADYAQWEASRMSGRPPKAVKPPVRPERKQERKGRKRLTYLEQREWEAMEATVLDAEARAEQATAKAEDPAIASDAAELHRRHEELTRTREEVDRLYARWAELEEKQAGE